MFGVDLWFYLCFNFQQLVGLCIFGLGGFGGSFLFVSELKIGGRFVRKENRNDGDNLWNIDEKKLGRSKNKRRRCDVVNRR